MRRLSAQWCRWCQQQIAVWSLGAAWATVCVLETLLLLQPHNIPCVDPPSSHQSLKTAFLTACSSRSQPSEPRPTRRLRGSSSSGLVGSCLTPPQCRWCRQPAPALWPSAPHHSPKGKCSSSATHRARETFETVCRTQLPAVVPIQRMFSTCIATPRGLRRSMLTPCHQPDAAQCLLKTM